MIKAMPFRKNIFIAIVLLLVCSLGTIIPAHAATGSSITVVMDNFRNDKGVALISLFASPDGFPQNYKKAYRYAKAPVRNGRARYTFNNIPAGRYAVSMLHDEDGNACMSCLLFVIPKEGFGVSREENSGFGIPHFDRSSFVHRTRPQIIGISVNYFG